MKTFLAIRRLLTLCLLLGSLLGTRGDAQDASLLAPASQPAASRPTWGVLDPMTRLLPIDSYDGPQGGPLGLTGARGEVADAQLVLLAGPQPWTGVQITFSDLRGPHKSVLSHTLLQWRQVGMVRTRRPYYATRYVGLWPDPLLPAAPLTVAAQGRAFAWINVHIPTDARAGFYSGRLTLASQSAAPLSVPFTLHVWGFTMPPQNHLRTSFGFQGQGQFPLKIGPLCDDMLAHRISPLNSAGQPERIALPGKPVQWDWTTFDKTLTYRLSQGLTGFNMSIPSGQMEWATAWQEHLKAKGWLGLGYTYLADEPPPGQLPAVNARLAQVRQAAPALANMVPTAGFPQQIAANLDIWCPEIRTFDPAVGLQEQARGKEVWWYPAYPTQHPFINLWIDYPALDCRIWPWLTWKRNVDGLLYWSVCYWTGTPDPLTQAPAFSGSSGLANGDGSLFYPGPGGKPLDSIRVEALRDGLQDYEVFCLLEAGVRELRASGKAPALAAKADALLAIDPAVVTNSRQYTQNPQQLLTTREQMSETMQQIVLVLGHQPQIVGRPRLHPELPHLQYQARQAAQTAAHAQ